MKKTIKVTEKQINLCSGLDRRMDKNCMKIKVEYWRADGDEDLGILTTITSSFLDDELDPFKIIFTEGCIEINTDNYTHISLNENHLLFLVQFYRYAKKIDDKCFNMTKSQAKSFK
jgi:hypothetical protein